MFTHARWLFQAATRNPTRVGGSFSESAGEREYHTCNSTPAGSLAISANPTANARWTLVYAQVTINTPSGVPVKRYNRSPADDSISSQDRTPILVTKVAAAVLDGTAAATPTLPTLPADVPASEIYQIALGCILVPSGFTALGTILRGWIEETAPVIGLHSATGASSCAPANQNYLPTGTVDVNQSGSTSAFRPGPYLPSTAVGEDVLRILIQLSISPPVHVDTSVIDTSRDWRWRYFDWTISATPGTTVANAFASDRRLCAASSSPSAPASQIGLNYTAGAGQSFIDDTGRGVAWGPSDTDGHGAAVYTHGGRITGVSTGGGAADALMIYVRSTDGALILRKTSGAGGQLHITLRASGPAPNHGTY